MKKSRKKELESKKRELKEDIFVQSMLAAWQKSTAMRRHIMTVAAAVAVIAVIVIVARVRVRAANRQALTELGTMKVELQQLPDDISEEERQEIQLDKLGELSGNIRGKARPAVLFEYARALFEKGGGKNLQLAEEQCRAFIEDYPKNYWYLPVRQLLGKILFEQGRYEKAEAEFGAVEDAFLAEKQPVMTPLRYEAAYYIGRCQELLGRTGQARETYRQLAERKYENEIWSGKAAYRLEKLGS